MLDSDIGAKLNLPLQPWSPGAHVLIRTYRVGAVARLLDKDKLGRTVLHAAAASGSESHVCMISSLLFEDVVSHPQHPFPLADLHAVRMLAARCSGWPVKFEPVKHGGISTEHSEHGAAKSRGHTHSSSSPRRQLPRLRTIVLLRRAVRCSDKDGDQAKSFISQSIPTRNSVAHRRQVSEGVSKKATYSCAICWKTDIDRECQRRNRRAEGGFGDIKPSARVEDSENGRWNVSSPRARANFPRFPSL